MFPTSEGNNLVSIFTKAIGKITKEYQGQLVGKSTLKVNNGLRASRQNPEWVGKGLSDLDEV